MLNAQVFKKQKCLTFCVTYVEEFEDIYLFCGILICLFFQHCLPGEDPEYLITGTHAYPSGPGKFALYLIS